MAKDKKKKKVKREYTEEYLEELRESELRFIRTTRNIKDYRK